MAKKYFEGQIDYYFERIEYYRDLRAGKGITQTDLSLAQKDILKKYKELNKWK